MTHIQPVHYDKKTVSQLTKELALASCKGAAQGAMIGLTSALLLRRFSTVYRNVRTQVRVFYHCAWISAGASFQADKQLINFQSKYFDQETERQQKVLDTAADNGVFLEEGQAATSTVKSHTGPLFRQ